MKKSLKKTQIVELHNVMFELQKAEDTTKAFGYVLSRNINKIQPEIESIKQLQQPPARLVEYEQKRISKCKEYAKKDDKNQPLVDGNKFVFEDDVKVADELSKLFKEYSDDIEQFNKLQTEINDIMNEEIEVELIPVSFKLFPDKLSGEKIDKLSPIIKESEDEILKIIETSGK